MAKRYRRPSTKSQPWHPHPRTKKPTRYYGSVKWSRKTPQTFSDTLAGKRRTQAPLHLELGPVRRTQKPGYGPGSKSDNRAEHAAILRAGIKHGKAGMAPKFMTPGGQPDHYTHKLYARGLAHGANVGSFKNRAGSWKKGKGGRFVGSN